MGFNLSWITDAVTGPSPVVSPDLPAVALDDAEPLTWGQLRESEIRLATALYEAGIRRGDRVGILMHNSVEYIVAYFAIARVGAISVRLNFRLTASELGFILEDSGATALLFDSDLTPAVEPLRDGPISVWVCRSRTASVPEWATELGEFCAGAGAVPDFPDMQLEDPLGLLYTSGTTGKPKGAIWTHGNTMWFATIQALKWGFDSTTVTLTPGPLFHAGGLEALLLPALLSHGTAVTFASGGFTVDRLLEVARAQRVTMMLLYSHMSYECLRMPNVEAALPKSLRRIVCGGDSLMPWVYDEFEKLLPGVEILQQYGLTEGGAVSTCLDHADARGRAGSVGKPMPLTEIRVVDGDGSSCVPGEVGEVLVRSPGVSPGYWRRPDATAATFERGWCRTGDLGSIDADGFLTLGGRAKDMIRSGGENIYPAEIESVLTSAPEVADAAVIGVPDERYTEVGLAVVVPAAGRRPDAESLHRYCETRLARYKIPKYFEFVDELPRTTSGKVQKHVLRSRVAKRADPDRIGKPPAAT